MWHIADDGALTGSRVTDAAGYSFATPRFTLREYSDGRLALTCNALLIPGWALGTGAIQDAHSDKRIQATLREIHSIAWANIERLNPQEILALQPADAGGPEAALAARVIAAVTKGIPKAGIEVRENGQLSGINLALVRGELLYGELVCPQTRVEPGDSRVMRLLLSGIAFEVVDASLIEAYEEIAAWSSAISTGARTSASESREFHAEAAHAREAVREHKVAPPVTSRNVAGLERLADKVVWGRERIDELIAITRSDAGDAAKFVRDARDTGDAVVELDHGYRIVTAQRAPGVDPTSSRPRVVVNKRGEPVEPVDGIPANGLAARDFLVASRSLLARQVPAVA